MVFGSFRQDRYYPDLFSPGRGADMMEPGLCDKEDLTAAEPLLYELDAVAWAIGYVVITPYNAEAV